MKKRLLLACSIAALAVMTGCNGGNKPAETTAATEAPKESESVGEPESETELDYLQYAYMGYDDIISAIIQEMQEGWHTSPEEYGISDIFSYAEQDKLGFLRQDINGDDIEELLLGEISHDGMTSVIYDLYTAEKDGSVIHLASGGERDRFYLCDDGTIVEEGSNGASDSFSKCYDILNGELAEKNTTKAPEDYEDIHYELFADYFQKEQSSTEMIGMANPWVELSAEELQEKAGITFKVPDGAENVIYRYMESQNLAEMQFELDGTSMCARIMPSKEFADISGVYAEKWDVEDDIKIDYCPGKMMRQRTTCETTDVCLWYDKVTGHMNSLVATAPDLDGFDITAIANQMFESSQGVVG